MAQKKPFLLRLDPAVYEALQGWADAEMRSLNGQIEFVLREALRQACRLKRSDEPTAGRAGRRRPDNPEG